MLPELKTTYNIILLRSAAFALSAYFGSLFAERFMISTLAVINGFSVSLQTDIVKVVSPVNSWDQEHVLLIYMFPYLILTISFVWLNIYFSKLEDKAGVIKLFLLWLMFFLLYRIMGIVPGNVIFKTGVHYILEWLFIPWLIRLIIGLVSLVVFYFAGYKILRGILTNNLIYQKSARHLGIKHLINSTVLYPLLIVTTSTILFNLPGLFTVETLGVGLIIVLAIVFFQKLSGLNPKYFDFYEEISEKVHPAWKFILVIGAVLIVRILLLLQM